MFVFYIQLSVAAFTNLMQSYHFIPTVDSATRFPPNNISEPSLLDHVWTNFVSGFSSGVIDFDLTDHCPVFIIMKHGNHDVLSTTRFTFRLQSEDNISKFKEELMLVEWNFDTYGDLDSRVNYFNDTISKIYNKCFPLKTKNMSSKRLQKPWITGDLINSIRMKSKYFKLYRQGLISREMNNRYRNDLNYLLRRV